MIHYKKLVISPVSKRKLLMRQHVQRATEAEAAVADESVALLRQLT